MVAFILLHLHFKREDVHSIFKCIWCLEKDKSLWLFLTEILVLHRIFMFANRQWAVTMATTLPILLRYSFLVHRINAIFVMNNTTFNGSSCISVLFLSCYFDPKPVALFPSKLFRCQASYFIFIFKLILRFHFQTRMLPYFHVPIC
jgi:hypothetical protein